MYSLSAFAVTKEHQGSNSKLSSIRQTACGNLQECARHSESGTGKSREVIYSLELFVGSMAYGPLRIEGRRAYPALFYGAANRISTESSRERFSARLLENMGFRKRRESSPNQDAFCDE